jgi:hypothetical protein
VFAVVSVFAHGSKALRLSRLPPPDDLLWQARLGVSKVEKTSRANLRTLTELPEALRGKRLVLIGDSNDRKFSGWLFSQVSAKHKGTKSKINALNGGLNFYGLATITEKNFEDHDLIVNYVWHGGVMSIPPQPSWHARQLQGGAVPWRQGIIPRWDNGTEVVSSAQIAISALQHFALTDKRPMIVVLQSSLWDSALAAEGKFFGQQFRNAAKEIEDWDFEDWDWLGKASEFVRAVQSVEKESRIEQLYWRTNANCPNSPNQSSSRNTWIDSITEKQAAAIRNAVSQRVPPWDNIGLFDWRQDYITTECDGIHYTPEGYEDLFTHLIRLVR